jgi:CheY-like chemotaxis protein
MLVIETRVSIVTPAYNAERFLPATIESVLRQTYRDWELHVVDDCSRDATRGVIEDYSVRDPRIRLLAGRCRGGAADTRTTMFAALELDGHRVYEAAGGNAGLRTIAAVKPDVAIIDIGLPGLDGYEMAAALRENLEHQKMVLIAITGFERPDSLRRAREAGFDDYVTKPIAPDRLVRLIDAALTAKARRSGSAS